MKVTQRALRKQINAILKSLGYTPRKHYAEFAFGTIDGRHYDSGSMDLDWDGRSGFGQDFPLADGDRLNLTIGWKECMYDSDEMERVSQGNNWIEEPTIRIVDGQASLSPNECRAGL